MISKPGRRDLLLLGLISTLAVAVHGYHPAVEDAAIYVPGIKKALNPSLYPYNSAFFTSHAHLTVFPSLVKGATRISHLSLDWTLLLLHVSSVFLLLLACWHIGRLAFRSAVARWGGVAIVAALLTIPVAGTALYILDEYLNPRSLSTPAILFVIINTLERKYLRALAWSVFTAFVHPLMVVFGLAYVGILAWPELRVPRLVPSRAAAGASCLLLWLPIRLLQPANEAYRELVQSNSYFFVLRWAWYEWLGVLAPLGILWWFRKFAEKKRLADLERTCNALVIFGALSITAALAITVPPQLLNLVLLQPMRAFQLVYILMFVFAGGLIAEFVLRNRAWRWALLFVPLCAGMYLKQRAIFPDSPHLELPGVAPANDWQRAFVWIRQNTPQDAYFALDPHYMEMKGEDQHGFRAVAERSTLADAGKDRSAMTMFLAMADTWTEQAEAQRGWISFQRSDFERLNKTFGVDWVVLSRPGVQGLTCPYENDTLFVCRI